MYGISYHQYHIFGRKGPHGGEVVTAKAPNPGPDIYGIYSNRLNIIHIIYKDKNINFHIKIINNMYIYMI